MRGYSPDIGVTLAYQTFHSQESLTQVFLFSSLFPSLPSILWTSHPPLSLFLLKQTSHSSCSHNYIHRAEGPLTHKPCKMVNKARRGQDAGKMDTKI